MTAPAGARGVFREFWEAPYRPLFLAAILYALVTVAWWPLGVWVGLPAPAFEPIVVWHVHELIFGFAAAAIGGYLLTALPGWTGNPPVRGTALKVLLSLWLLARFAMALAGFVPSVLLVAVNAGYFLLLAGIIGHQLVLASAYHKLGFFLAVGALGTSEFLFLGASLAGSSWRSLAWVNTLLLGLVILMVGIATRAIPAFSRNWFVQTGQTARMPQGRSVPVSFAQFLLVLAVVAQVAERFDLSYFAMIGAALTLLWDMGRWQSLMALPNPLLAALHLAYLWLPLGLMAVGVSGLAPAVYPMADALHAVTIGGMSGLIMAIAGRAAAHSKSGDLRANAGFKIGVLLVWIACWVRLAAPFFPHFPVVLISAAVWCIGWTAFMMGFLPALTGPVRRPVLSGRSYLERRSIGTEDRSGC